MSTIRHFKSMGSASRGLSRLAVALIFCGAVLSTLAFPAGAAREPLPANQPRPGEPSPRTSVDRAGTLQTQDGLTLRLTADLGSMRIVTLEAGTPPAVHYSVHIETDA